MNLALGPESEELYLWGDAHAIAWFSAKPVTEAVARATGPSLPGAPARTAVGAALLRP